MKRTGLVIVFLSLFRLVSCFAQVYVDGVAIDTANTPFCQLICSNAGLLNKTIVMIDYGQRYVNTGLNRQRIAGPDRQPITFNSSIDALNFMVRQGWVFVSSQVTGTESGAENRFIYMLRWPKKSDERF